MYKVLIVDDELLVRNYIRSLLEWEVAGFQVCGEAANGKEALRQIETIKPDVLIMDINMPVMDVVALSERISKEFSHIKMLILSSFDDYQFVRETLKNGAVDYILKDRLDQDEMTRVLKQIKDVIDQEKRKKSELEFEKKSIEEIKEIAAEQCIKELFLGTREYTDEMIERIGLPFKQIYKGGFVVAVMQVGSYHMRVSSMSDMEKEQFIRSVRNLCRQTLGEPLEKLVVYLDDGRFGFVFPLQRSYSEASIHSFISQNAKKISYSLNQYFNVQALWGTSSKCNLPDRINHCFDEALQALNTQSYLKQSKFESYDASALKPDSRVFSVSLHHEKELLLAIESGDLDRTEKTIDAIFEASPDIFKLNESFQLVVNELITTAIKVSSEYNLDSKKIYEACGVDLSTLILMKDAGVLKAAIKSIYKALIEESAKNCNAGNYSEYSRRAIDYIRLNYKKDISQVEVSEILGINPAYFSRLFRKDTNYGFIEYLNKVRIEMAKKRMDNGEKNLKKVCYDVGFKSYSYFFKVFKELTGTTPLSFIDQKSRGKAE